MIGAVLAGADEDEILRMERYRVGRSEWHSRSSDDILDVTSTERNAGKTDSQ